MQDACAWHMPWKAWGVGQTEWGKANLKQQHISTSPVIDCLVAITHYGHSLPAAASKGVQQPVLAVSDILKLIQLQKNKCAK